MYASQARSFLCSHADVWQQTRRRTKHGECSPMPPASERHRCRKRRKYRKMATAPMVGWQAINGSHALQYTYTHQRAGNASGNSECTASILVGLAGAGAVVGGVLQIVVVPLHLAWLCRLFREEKERRLADASSIAGN